MEQIEKINKQITDFIYDSPDVVVLLLQQSGYSIDMKTATLYKINDLVWKALYIDENMKFAENLDSAIANEGNLNIIPLLVMAAVSIVTSLVGAGAAKKAAEKQRELQRQIAYSQMALDEKIAMEKLRVEAETARLGILANTLLEYRKTLQTESTARLKDTWLYVTGLGIGMGIFYGLYLFVKKD